MNAGGGSRTHTRFHPHRILNPARLPIPPLRPSGLGRNMLPKVGHIVNPTEPWFCVKLAITNVRQDYTAYRRTIPTATRPHTNQSKQRTYNFIIDL